MRLSRSPNRRRHFANQVNTVSTSIVAVAVKRKIKRRSLRFSENEIRIGNRAGKLIEGDWEKDYCARSRLAAGRRFSATGVERTAFAFRSALPAGSSRRGTGKTRTAGFRVQLSVRENALCSSDQVTRFDYQSTTRLRARPWSTGFNLLVPKFGRENTRFGKNFITKIAFAQKFLMKSLDRKSVV